MNNFPADVARHISKLVIDHDVNAKEKAKALAQIKALERENRRLRDENQELKEEFGVRPDPEDLSEEQTALWSMFICRRFNVLF